MKKANGYRGVYVVSGPEIFSFSGRIIDDERHSYEAAIFYNGCESEYV